MGDLVYGVDVDLWNAAASARDLKITYVAEPTFDVLLDKVCTWKTNVQLCH